MGGGHKIILSINIVLYALNNEIKKLFVIISKIARLTEK